MKSQFKSNKWIIFVSHNNLDLNKQFVQENYPDFVSQNNSDFDK